MFKWTRKNRLRKRIEESHKEAALENAERDLEDLKVRGARAMHALDTRHNRNHWRESIERMIQGAH